MFTAAFFLTAKTWKRSRCPFLGEQINKLWYMKAIKYYSALKRNELPSHEDTEESYVYLLREARQFEKAICYMIRTHDILKKAKL